MRREIEAGRDRLTVLGADVEKAADAAGSAGSTAAEALKVAIDASSGHEQVAQQIATLDSRAQGLRAELGAGRERLDALGSEIERMGDGLTEAHAGVTATRRAIETEAEALREELRALRTVAEEAGAGLEALRAQFDAVRQSAEATRTDAEMAKAATRTGEQRIEAMQAEVTYALKSIEDLKQGLTSAGQAAVIARREAEQAKKAVQNAGEGSSNDQVSAVFQQLLGLAGTRPGKRPSQILPAVKKESKVERAPRHGFDDASTPMAVLTLEGKFRELNPAFTKLVGYKEADFFKAAWPSPHDRRDYQEQQDQLRQLASGEVESVSVQSTYMHGQGLMVPVVGRLTAVPGEDGLPLHLLLEAEERHTS
jgi:PAS domain S-box-containing protein